MGTTTEAVIIDIQAKNEDKVKSLKSQIKEATNEVGKLTQQYGEFDSRTAQAIKHLAQLRDVQGDINQRVKALSPDRFERIANIGQGLVGGFSAYSGVLALVGDQSKDWEQTMVRLQGAISLSQGLQSLKGFKEEIKVMTSGILPGLKNAFTTVGGAAKLIGQSLGIGLIITGITFLIENFEKVKNAVKNFANAIPGLTAVFTALGDAWDWLKEKAQSLTDAIGLTNSALDKQKDTSKERLAQMAHEIEVMKARGDSVEAIYFKEKAFLQKTLADLKTFKGSKEEIQAAQDKLEILYAENTKRVNEKKQRDQESANQKAQTELEKQQRNKLQSEEETKRKEKEIQDNANAIQIKTDEDLFKLRHDARTNDLHDLEKKYKDEYDALVKAGKDTNLLTELFLANKKAINDKYNAEAKANRDKIDEERKATIQSWNDYVASVDKAAADKTTEKNKKDLDDATAIAAAKRNLALSSINSAAMLGQFLINNNAKSTEEQKKNVLVQLGIDEASAIGSMLVGIEEASAATGPAYPITKTVLLIQGFATIAANFLKARQAMKAIGSSSAGGYSPNNPSLSNTTTSRILSSGTASGNANIPQPQIVLPVESLNGVHRKLNRTTQVSTMH